jgi:hypothetical protein
MAEIVGFNGRARVALVGAEVREDAESGTAASDAVVDAYKRDIDRSLLRENLKLTVEQRIQKLAAFLDLVGELRRAGRVLRGS